ncbi:MAG: DUF4369 domain-containing protein [Bacteroidales bacterium]|nr:DUF4369 domain-containing protein [Bacteroidales bacterium]
MSAHFSAIKKAFATAISLVSLIGCTSGSYTIECTFDDSFDGNKLLLYNLEADDFKSSAIDSAIIVSGKAFFSGKVEKEALCMLLCENGEYLNLILEKGYIVVSIASDHEHFVLGGTPLNNALAAYELQTDSINNAFADRYDEVFNNQSISNDDRTEQINILIDDFSRQSVERAQKTIAANRNNPLGQYAFWMDIAYNSRLSKAQYDKYLAEAGEYIASFPQIAMQTKRIAAADRTSAGSPFADVQFNDTTKLSDFLSDTRYTLVEVWTTNNSDCYRNTYFMRSIRKRYSPDELGMVSILTEALPNYEADSEEARAEWACAVDTKRSMRDVYGFQALPFMMLIAPDGTIVGRNIRSEALDLWIRTELKKE